MKIIVSESILPGSPELLRAAREIRLDPRSFVDRTALTAAARDVDATCVRRLTQARDAPLDAMARCKIFGRSQQRGNGLVGEVLELPAA
ncbi:hypothetical protein GWE18_24255 [Bradyrhizobium sp. CSA112]|uniref:hypothetical protein n=1 Tax=Bradyrhizobium sp. CSA112 TaxID=2699170 RepID=UPI0023B1608C|nr:hypothetical protein [Bradyrhizobium sp. CSA112]MDE5455894.1 hypothetical protein [Bradyrhizobium sp. CSA112]